MPKIFVYGLRSWRGEVLALCWARWDEDWPERCEILLELLSLPDSTLEATFGTFANCLTPAFGHARPACRVEQLLWRLVEIREQDPKFRDMKLVDLIDAFGARQADNPLVSVISALENEWAAFEEVIGSHENEIRRLVEVQVARLPAPRTWTEAMRRSSEASEIESAIIETLRETGTLPTS